MTISLAPLLKSSADQGICCTDEDHRHAAEARVIEILSRSLGLLHSCCSIERAACSALLKSPADQGIRCTPLAPVVSCAELCPLKS